MNTKEQLPEESENQEDNAPRVLQSADFHELADRTFMMADVIENHLIDHHVCDQYTEWKIKLQKAQELLMEVYQHAGSMM